MNYLIKKKGSNIMNNKYFIRMIIIAGFILMQATIKAQEFPIAVGSDTTFSGGAVYGGLNGIVAVQGDPNSQHSINAQLVGAGGILIGPRISLGANGVMPGAIPVFDGTNYFLVWCEFSGNIKGQFINTSGTLVGSSFTISSNTNSENFNVVFGDTEFLVVFTKSNNLIYGQRVSKSGNLIGSQIQISSMIAKGVSLAYDGTNFLAAWDENTTGKYLYGQFISKTGSLVGSNFLIDGGSGWSDNPASLAFDGTRYLLAFGEQPYIGANWFILGRFISTSGAIEETITICDSSKAPFFPSVAFDNNNYLTTWAQLSDNSLMGRFFNKAGVPITEPFVIFGALGNKIPIGGVGFGGGQYLVVATRINSNFSDGDVFGRFLQPITGVEDESNLIPEKFALFQNYPNPFNPSTTVSYLIPNESKVTIKVFDILGNEIATLVDELKEPGLYSIKFDASLLSNGIYFLAMKAADYTQTKKMILIK
jgi:Secretion system C-terminal sorting domain